MSIDISIVDLVIIVISIWKECVIIQKTAEWN